MTTTPATSSPAPLPRVPLRSTLDDALVALETAAKRGRLAGFARAEAGRRDGAAFTCAAFGSPFDGELTSRAEGDSPVRLAFTARLKPKGPIIWWIALILTVWPGVVLTETMVATLFPQWPWLWKNTWWWYMPLTVPFVPWLGWSATAKSRRAVMASARVQVAAIAKELGVEPESGGPASPNAGAQAG